MTMANYSWEEDTRRYLGEVRAELIEANKRLESAKGDVDRLAREVEAYELALQSRLTRSGKEYDLKQDIRGILAGEKNHEARLKKLAEQNNGIIKVGPATDILFNYGFIKSKSRMNAYRVVYGLLKDMAAEGDFQKIGPSEYRLPNTQTKLPAIG